MVLTTTGGDLSIEESAQRPGLDGLPGAEVLGEDLSIHDYGDPTDAQAEAWPPQAPC